MTSAQLAQGMTISWGGNSIDEVTNFTLAYSVDQVEVTNHDSAGRAREYIAGLFTPSELTFSVNYVASSHGPIIAQAGDDTAVDTLTVTLPDGSDTFSVDAWVKGYSMPGSATGEALTMDITFQTTGPVTNGGS